MLVTTIIEDGKRPCYVQLKEFNGEKHKAIFHRWIELSCPITQTLALVEYEDGSVAQVKPTSIIFADGGDFDILTWEEENNESESNTEDVA